jgi:hypothetical protein
LHRLAAVSGALEQVQQRVASAGDDINGTTIFNPDNLLAESSSYPVSESVSSTDRPQRKLRIQSIIDTYRFLKLFRGPKFSHECR